MWRWLCGVSLWCVWGGCSVHYKLMWHYGDAETVVLYFCRHLLATLLAVCVSVIWGKPGHAHTPAHTHTHTQRYTVASSASYMLWSSVSCLQIAMFFCSSTPSLLSVIADCCVLCLFSYLSTNLYHFIYTVYMSCSESSPRTRGRDVSFVIKRLLT